MFSNRQILITLFLLGLIGLAASHFVVFHTVVELTTVLVASIIALVGWYSRRDKHACYILGLGSLYATLATIDFLHTVTYKGSGLFISSDVNLPTQFWVLGRLIEAVGLLLVFSCLAVGRSTRCLVPLFPTLGLLGLFSIYPAEVFPDTFVDGEGLTPFKVNSEYLVILLVGCAGAALKKARQRFNAKQYRHLLAALSLTLAAEFCFTQYVTVYDMANTVGHLFRLLSCYYLFRALIMDANLAGSDTLARLNLKPFLAALLVALTALGGATLIYDHESRMQMRSEQFLAEKRAQEYAAALSIAMQARLRLTDSLKAFVLSSEDVTAEEFENFANILGEKMPGIISLQLAPNGIVTHVTNPERNRAAIGHNLLAGEDKRAAAERAIRDNTFVIVGPRSLIQGGQAVIARQPIFTDNHPVREKFWGFATILIDVEPLLDEVGIHALEEDYEIAIKTLAPTGGSNPIFYGSEPTLANPIAAVEVALNTTQWVLYLSLKSEHRYRSLIVSPWYWLATLLATFVLLALFYRHFNRSYELAIRVQGATRSLRDEADRRKQAERRATELANHDSLTGLPNRRLFDELASSTLQLAHRQSLNTAMLFMDLDGFKGVNDTLGHQAGDALLCQVAERMRAALRSADVLARLGGDEFVVLVNCQKGEEGAIAEKLIAALSAPFEIQGETAQIGVSIGIALSTRHGTELRTLMRKADDAMYEAKHSGKNCYRIFDPTEP